MRKLRSHTGPQVSPKSWRAAGRTALATVLLSGCLWCPAAYAQSTPAADTTTPSERATALFEQGKQLFAKGQFRESREAYLEAYALRKSYDIAANLGNVEAKLGRWADAAEHLTFALENLPPTLGAAKRQAAEDKIRQRLKEAAKHIGTLKLAVQPAGAEVLIDGKAIGTAPIERDIFLEPGRHVIETQLAGHEAKTEAVQMKAGEDIEVALTLKAAASSGGNNGGDDDGAGGPNLPLVIAGGGVAVAALGTGVAMMVLSAGKGSDRQALVDGLASNSECAPGGTIHPSCGEIQSLADDERLFQGIGIGMLVAGGVIAAGTLTYALWPQGGDGAEGDGADSATIRLAPMISPQSGGALLWGSF